MNTELLMALRFLLAVALGAAIGYQREKSHKPAGLRTHILISAGAALFTLISNYAFPESDPSRIAAGVVTGIGFIGAGTILHRTRFCGGSDYGGQYLGSGSHRHGGGCRYVYHLGSGCGSRFSGAAPAAF